MKFRVGPARTFWQVLLILLIFIMVIINQFDWFAMFSANAGWINLVKGLGVGNKETQQKEKGRAAFLNFGNAANNEGWNIDNISYGNQLAFLSFMDNDETFSSVLSANPQQSRGLIHLWSLLRLCDQRNGKLALLEANCQNIIPIAGSKLLNHELLPDLHQWNCSQIMEWLILSKEVQNTQQKSFWESKLMIECSELYVAYQDQNLNIKFQQALALNRLGLTNRAIMEGEKALAVSNWHWGHFLVAQFYEDIDDFNNAENHLLEAISLDIDEEIIPQYHYTLAKIYQVQDRQQEAAGSYCNVVNIKQDTTQTQIWKPKAEMEIKRMLGNYQIDIVNFCKNI